MLIYLRPECHKYFIMTMLGVNISRMFLRKIFIGGGTALIVFSLLSDRLGLGTGGFGIGPGQKAILLVGISLIAWGIIIVRMSPFKRYGWALILAFTLFMVWYCWLYPASGYKFTFDHHAPRIYKVLIGSQIFLILSFVLFTGIAGWTAWHALRDPQQKTDFLHAHRVFYLKRKTTIFVVWMLLWGIGFLGLAELISRQVLEMQIGLGKRPIQPYLANGDFYDYYPDEVMMAKEGPEAYGYYRSGGVYFYDFKGKVQRIADRGNFLFQDRIEIANNLTRSDVIRIFVIGGSVAYGTGASSNEKKWYILLEQALSAALKREVRLIPAAMGAYNTTQERLVLDLMVLPRKPDAIIILDGFNDTSPISRPGDPYNQGALYEHFYSPGFGIKKWLTRHSFLYQYVVNTSLQQSQEIQCQRILQDSELLKNYTTSVASVYFDNVLNMLERCEESGIPCIAFLQPMRALTLHNQHIHSELSSQEKLFLAAYQEILDNVPKLTLNKPFYDLTSVFDAPGSEKWYSDFVHFTDPGHQVMADAMYPTCIEFSRNILHTSSRKNVDD